MPQEVQVETIGTMSKRDKTAYILEQMRLCLAKKDFIRTAIISKKINPDVFKDETLQDLKVKYYELMIQKHAIDKSYLESAKAFYAIFDTPSVQVRRQGRRQDDQPLPSASCCSASCCWERRLLCAWLIALPPCSAPLTDGGDRL